jgi:hypothetical protein
MFSAHIGAIKSEIERGEAEINRALSEGEIRPSPIAPDGYAKSDLDWVTRLTNVCGCLRRQA